jgi:putative redox protein
MPEKTTATLQWITGLRFVAQGESGHGVLMDSKSRPAHLGASPMELMLISIAGCTAIDVVAILEKMREPLRSLTVGISGDRAESHPKRYTALEIVYRVSGTGLSREKVERAVGLSHSTYCSALASLRPDCPVTFRIEFAQD